MSRTLLLHIGMHKTGSSSIQSSLRRYDDGQTFYGIFDDVNHSIPLYTAFCDDPQRYHIWESLGLSKEKVLARKSAYLDEFSHMLSRHDRRRLIVSAEDVGVLSDAGKGRLLDFVAAHDVEVRLLCYLRDPCAYAASATQELVKHGFFFEGLSQVRRLCLPNYKGFLEYFLTRLPPQDLTLRAYDRRSLVGNDVVSDFCEWAEIDLSGLTVVTSNESQSLSATRLIHSFNKAQIVRSGDPVTLDAYRKLVVLVGGLYSGSEKLKASMFEGIVDQTDVDWLTSATGIVFDRADSEILASDLIEYLQDISQIDGDLLAPSLREIGVEGVSQYDTTQRLVRLYLGLIAQEDWSGKATHVRQLDAALAECDALRAERDALQAERDTAEAKAEALAASYRHATRYPWKYLIDAFRQRLH